ncbi:hypothetical protein MOD07_02345 [Bacillus mojavensis]|uniref:Uncharacterized protein n=1 Tax=Bacillus mojavensis TaxID=72360 RepID=A0AAP3CPW5_BACMO|nr:hypothetical protein [Bacillus mojavensis]MCY8508400.1 hypothetical protein [Bacillus mojavensis]
MAGFQITNKTVGKHAPVFNSFETGINMTENGIRPLHGLMPCPKRVGCH